MALEMRPNCEKCAAHLPMNSKEAFVCSYECTFCAKCAETTGRICPNCGGELVRRPTRIPKS
jgi:hypothetical protein